MLAGAENEKAPVDTEALWMGYKLKLMQSCKSNLLTSCLYPLKGIVFVFSALHHCRDAS